jgi:hypothetical protein
VANIQVDRWAVNEPAFEYEKLAFALRYTVSDQNNEQQIAYSLYDGAGCKEESNEISKIENNPFLRSKLTLSEASTNGTKEAILSLKLDPEQIVSTTIFHHNPVDDTQATVAFCVRLGLYTGNSESPDSMEVNFVETPVQLHINLRDEFQIDLVGETEEL